MILPSGQKYKPGETYKLTAREWACTGFGARLPCADSCTTSSTLSLLFNHDKRGGNFLLHEERRLPGHCAV
jgi:hypothetical protein